MIFEGSHRFLFQHNAPDEKIIQVTEQPIQTLEEAQEYLDNIDELIEDASKLNRILQIKVRGNFTRIEKTVIKYRDKIFESLSLEQKKLLDEIIPQYLNLKNDFPQGFGQMYEFGEERTELELESKPFKYEGNQEICDCDTYQEVIENINPYDILFVLEDLTKQFGAPFLKDFTEKNYSLMFDTLEADNSYLSEYEESLYKIIAEKNISLFLQSTPKYLDVKNGLSYLKKALQEAPDEKIKEFFFLAEGESFEEEIGLRMINIPGVPKLETYNKFKDKPYFDKEDYQQRFTNALKNSNQYIFEHAEELKSILPNYDEILQKSLKSSDGRAFTRIQYFDIYKDFPDAEKYFHTAVESVIAYYEQNPSKTNSLLEDATYPGSTQTTLKNIEAFAPEKYKTLLSISLSEAKILILKKYKNKYVQYGFEIEYEEALNTKLAKKETILKMDSKSVTNLSDTEKNSVKNNVTQWIEDLEESEIKEKIQDIINLYPIWKNTQQVDTILQRIVHVHFIPGKKNDAFLQRYGLLQADNPLREYFWNWVQTLPEKEKKDIQTHFCKNNNGFLMPFENEKGNIVIIDKVQTRLEDVSENKYMKDASITYWKEKLNPENKKSFDEVLKNFRVLVRIPELKEATIAFLKEKINTQDPTIANSFLQKIEHWEGIFLDHEKIAEKLMYTSMQEDMNRGLYNFPSIKKYSFSKQIAENLYDFYAKNLNKIPQSNKWINTTLLPNKDAFLTLFIEHFIESGKSIESKFFMNQSDGEELFVQSILLQPIHQQKISFNIPVGIAENERIAYVRKYAAKYLTSKDRIIEQNKKSLILEDESLIYFDDIQTDWFPRQFGNMTPAENISYRSQIARNIYFSGIVPEKINKRIVKKAFFEIQESIHASAEVELFKDRNIIFSAHNEYKSDGKSSEHRFGQDGMQQKLSQIGKTFDFHRPVSDTFKSLKKAKEDTLSSLEKSGIPMTFFFDGHGGPDGLYFSDGNAVGSDVTESANTIKISPEELAESLLKRSEKIGKNPLLKNRDVLILASCFNHTYLRKVLDIMREKDGTLPIIVGASEYGQLAFDDQEDQYGTKFARHLLGLDGETPFTLKNAIDVQSQFYEKVRTNMSVYIPMPDEGYIQVAMN